MPKGSEACIDLPRAIMTLSASWEVYGSYVFWFHHVLLLSVWLEAKGEATAANEADYTSVILWSVGLE